MRGEKGGKYDNGIVCDSEESSHYRYIRQLTKYGH